MKFVKQSKILNHFSRNSLHKNLIAIFLLSFLFIPCGFGQTPPPKHILFLGDSLTEGEGLDEKHAFPAIIKTHFEEKRKNENIVVTNGGVSGSTSASGLKRLKWHLKTPVDILVLELGANDGLRGLKVEETQRNLESIIAYAKEKSIKVLLLGILMPPNYGKKYTESFAKMYKDLSQKFQLPLMPFVLEGVAGNPKLNLADGIHPNIEGHQVIAKNIYKFLEKHL